MGGGWAVLDWLGTTLIQAGIALFIAVVAMRAMTRAVVSHRARDYAVRTHAVPAQFGLPPIEQPSSTPSAASRRLQSLADLVAPIHAQAIEAQTVYHAYVVKSATCVGLAFCALAITATPWEELRHLEPIHALVEQGGGWALGEGLTRVLALLDVIAMGLLFYFYRKGIDADRKWIWLRIEAELLRQYEFIALVFPSIVVTEGPRDLTSQLEAEHERIKKQVLENSSDDDVSAQIDRFWSARRSAIENSALAEPDLARDALLTYLKRRPLRQLDWFTESMGRLQRTAKGRKNRLVLLFSVALVLVLFKLAGELSGGHAATGQVPLLSWAGLRLLTLVMLEPVLLILVGWSAAEAAYYLNQNSRSLIHRYYTQKRSIENCLTRFKKSAWLTETKSPLTAPTKNELCGLILQFEDLMIEELIDWIHISTHDVIEISP